MRRTLAPSAALLLASAMVMPMAAPVAADSACQAMGHFFTVTVSFPAGYWHEGSHTLTFSVDPYFTEPYTFDVDADVPLQPAQVLMTPGETGIDLLALDHLYLDAVNPDQPTVARYIVGSDDLAFLVWARTRTTMMISWDGGPAVVGHQGGISSSCVYGGPNKTTVAEWYRGYAAYQKG